MVYIAARAKKQCIVINSIEAKNDYDSIAPESLSVSPDNKHLAYEARKDTKTTFVIDDAQGKEHAGSLKGSRLIWDSPTSVHALVLRGEKKEEKDVVRLQIDITGG